MTQLTFGTAGLRAPVGPGPGQMNVKQVARTTTGVATWLAQRSARLHLQHAPLESVALHKDDGPLQVVVGFDARYGSHTFATTAAEVLAGAGVEVLLLPTPTPTPLIPWLIRDRKCDAGIQITASQNPATDNGYKVYDSDGRQITTEDAHAIEAAIAEVGQVPRVTVRPGADQLRRYLDEVVDLVNPAADLLRINNERAACRVVYTAMHGVGGRALHHALQASGFALSFPVEEQQHPDPTFPTVRFPNPEEPEAVEMLLATAAEVEADVLVALDPDADRCAVGYRRGTEYIMLRGDELGPLLAHRLVPPGGVVATTVVSSQLLKKMAERRGWGYCETLTGFKNLSRAHPDLVFAYEEAVGTSPAPQLVPDKDGIATALIACAWAAELKALGRTLGDELDSLHREFGVHLGTQVPVRTTAPQAFVDALLNSPPTELAGLPATLTMLPAGQGLVFTCEWEEGTLRLIARASGTERKAKLYLEVVSPSRRAAERALAELRKDAEELAASH